MGSGTAHSVIKSRISAYINNINNCTSNIKLRQTTNTSGINMHCVSNDHQEDKMNNTQNSLNLTQQFTTHNSSRNAMEKTLQNVI